MPVYDVSIHSVINKIPKVTNMEVTSRTPIGAGVSALMALNIQHPHFTLTVKPMKVLGERL